MFVGFLTKYMEDFSNVPNTKQRATQRNVNSIKLIFLFSAVCFGFMMLLSFLVHKSQAGQLNRTQDFQTLFLSSTNILLLVFVLLFSVVLILKIYTYITKKPLFFKTIDVNNTVNSIGKFGGVIKSAGKTSDKTFFSDQSFVWYYVAVKRYLNHKKVFPKDPIYEEVFESEPFYVENETGRVLVYPQKAHVDVLPSLSYEIDLDLRESSHVVYEDDIEKKIAKFLGDKILVEKMRPWVDFYVHTLSVGEKVYIQGLAQQGVDLNGSPILVFKSTKDVDLVITTESPKEKGIKIVLGIMFLILAIAASFLKDR